jgi:selenocysteine-specific elongation factor
MHVLATAGHVDHGKSTLVRLLTGMEPDRWAEERRRGLTIDLGFAWTELPGGQEVAFVDVPGHERFVPNMLAGIGPVPAVVFVVAADGGWMPQSAEHLAALHALDVRHGLLVVTRADLADPEQATARALEEIGATSLGAVPSVAVSGRTGAGLDRLRAELAALVDRLPAPDLAADVRLWVDRSFSVRGAGTVVTGTLTAGRLRVGDDLVLSSTGERVRIRGLQSLGRTRPEVEAVARVAVNLRGVEAERAGRGDAVLAPRAWRTTDAVDVRVTDAELPRNLVLHLGSAAVPVRVRPLGTDTARLALARPLPLRVGDRGLLRDPGRHHVSAGVTVLDIAPPTLDRRGAARQRDAELTRSDPAELYLRRHGFARVADLRNMGLRDVGVPLGDWRADGARWAGLLARAADEVSSWRQENPVAGTMPEDVLAHRLEMPAGLVGALVAAAGVRLVPGDELPPEVEKAVRRLEDDLAASPFAAPEAARLVELGLGKRELAAAVRAGRLTRIADGVVLGPDAYRRAAEVLAGLPQPFTVSEARQALATTRRVAVPLLEHLDAQRTTTRRPDGTRLLVH